MVIRLLPIMEDEELEALRLAALQTLKPRSNFERFKKYGNRYNHNYHHNAPHHHSTKPFARMDHNPNLIVIIPTEVKEEKPADNVATSVTKNGTSVVEPEVIPLASTAEERKQAQEPEIASKVEESPEKSKKQVPARFKRESRDEEDLELDFEEELDFECEVAEETDADDGEESIALHADETDTITLDVEDSDKLALDDEDSLDKLMDEMEQEFSGKSPEKTTVDPPKKRKVEGPKTTPKATPHVPKPSDPQKSAANPKEKIAITSEPASERKPLQTGHSMPTKAASRSPPLHSETASAKSPQRPRSPLYRRSKSPRRSPVLSRRSPPPRRPSRSPVPRRSRSPVVVRRSKSPYRRVSPYKRSKSPLHRRSPGRRLSPLPRYSPRRSPPPLTRRSRTRSRTPPPRREYRSRSPLPLRRRSRSPSYHRRSLSPDRRRPILRRSISPRRRSPSPLRGNARRRTPPPSRRSPLPSRRSPLPVRSTRRRSASPNRRPLSRRSPIRRQPREAPSARPSESDSRSRPLSGNDRRRSPLDNRSDPVSRRESHTRPRSDEDPERNKPSDPIEEADPKLEARRRKFETVTVVSGTQKKICLKSSSDENRPNSPVSSSCATKDITSDEVVELVDESVAPKTQRSSPFNRIGRGNLAEDRGHQTRITINTTKDTQTKKLPGLFDDENEKEERKLKSIRYTVEDAKEEIELMKLKRRRKTEQILGEEGENFETLHIKKKKKKKDKEEKKEERLKRKEKKREMLLASLADVEDSNAKAADRVGVTTSARPEGTDLRAELSRRRAQRLQGQPGSRLIQSALEGVVADKKIKSARLSPPADGTSSDDPNKMKGRRVQVVAATKKKYTGEDSASHSEESVDEEEPVETKRMTSTATGILRGTTLRRRSQVLKK